MFCLAALSNFIILWLCICTQQRIFATPTSLLLAPTDMLCRGFFWLAQLGACAAVRRSENLPSSNVNLRKKMTDKVWLTDTEVGTRFGSTRQWVWTQARNNPQFPRPVKITPRWTRWCLQEIEAFEQEARAARG